MVTSEKTFVVNVPESQASMLGDIWSTHQTFYDCFYFVWELKKHYDLSKANSEASAEDKAFVNALDHVLKGLSDHTNYPGSNVLKSLTKHSEPDRFYNEYKDLSYTERGALNDVMQHVSGRR